MFGFKAIEFDQWLRLHVIHSWSKHLDDVSHCLWWTLVAYILRSRYLFEYYTSLSNIDRCVVLRRVDVWFADPAFTLIKCFFSQSESSNTHGIIIWWILFNCTYAWLFQYVEVFMCIVKCWMITFSTHGPCPADLTSTITMPRHYITSPGVSTRHAAVLWAITSVESRWAV